MHGVDEQRAVRVRLDFLAQPGDRAVDRPRQGRLRVAPDLSQEFVAIDDPVPALGEIPQQLAFPAR